MSFRSRTAWLTCFGTLVLVAGCDSAEPTGTVSGTVSVDGKAFSNAAVVFFNTVSGQGGTANIEKDGRYAISNPLPTGEYVVYMAPRIAEVDVSGQAVSEPGTEGPIAMTADRAVPDKYWNEASSDIRATVNAGANEVPVDLSSGE